MATQWASLKDTFPASFLMPAGVMMSLLLWSYWPTLNAAATKWGRDPQYSHGYLVPVFSIVLLLLRAPKSPFRELKVNVLGIPLLIAGAAIRLVNSLVWNVDWLDGISFVASMGAVGILLGGLPLWRWSWPAIAFLVFMLPLPYRVERALGGELQTLATKASTQTLQLIGVPATSEGNVILVHDRRLGVADACSGLSMLLIFVALAVAFAAVVDRPFLDRTLLVASSIPIAVGVNILRITVTGALHVWVGSRIADLVFHDLAGWLMMPMALGILWVESRILSYVFDVESRVSMERIGSFTVEHPLPGRVR